MQNNVYSLSDEGIKKDLLDRNSRIEKIIENVIRITITTFPEISSPLKRLVLKRVEETIDLTTDGYYIFYNFKKVRDSYESFGYKELLYQLLHTTFHYINNDHVTAEKFEDKSLINVILDQNIKTVLHMMGLTNPRNNMYLGLLSQKKAYPHYSYYECIEDLNKRNCIISLKDDFISDNHEMWCYSKKRKKENEIVKKAWSNVRATILKGDTDLLNGVIKWMSESGNRKIFYGDGTCDAIQVHSPDKSKLCIDFEEDLSDFLTSAVKSGEYIDSIDSNLYVYGLNIYEDMPLVEPADEEDDCKNLDTLFVAIDTSGSCAEVSDRFLNVLGEYLFHLKRYMGDKEIILLQCDTKIKSEERFTASDIYSGMFEKKQLIGFGGTSFIPVFDRINEYIEEGGSVSGVIYLSDGYGEFPDKRVGDYPVLFVLPDEDDDVDLPEYIKKTIVRNA